MLNQLYLRIYFGYLVFGYLEFENNRTTNANINIDIHFFRVLNLLLLLSLFLTVSKWLAAGQAQMTGSLIFSSNFKEWKGPIQPKLSYVD